MRELPTTDRAGVLLPSGSLCAEPHRSQGSGPHGCSTPGGWSDTQTPGSHLGLQSQILIPRPMGEPPDHLTCDLPPNRITAVHLSEHTPTPRVHRNAQHPEAAPSPAGCGGCRGSRMSPVGHDIGSQNAEFALISPRKVSGPKLSDLDYAEGGVLACRIREWFAQEPSTGQAAKHTYFILFGDGGTQQCKARLPSWSPLWGAVRC